jgi:hypothetical protein
MHAKTWEQCQEQGMLNKYLWMNEEKISSALTTLYLINHTPLRLHPRSHPHLSFRPILQNLNLTFLISHHAPLNFQPRLPCWWRTPCLVHSHMLSKEGCVTTITGQSFACEMERVDDHNPPGIPSWDKIHAAGWPSMQSHFVETNVIMHCMVTCFLASFIPLCNLELYPQKK